MKTGRLWGVAYQVNPFWLLAFALLLVSVVTSVEGAGGATLPDSARLAVSALVVLLFVPCIVLHELSHTFVERRLDLPDRPIEVLTLGRPVEAEPDPTSAASELLVAAAGPLLSAAIGGLLLLVAGLVQSLSADAITYLYLTCWWLGLANLLLAAVHLVPVLPLDGGRITRAVVWSLGRDLDRATSAAALVGRLSGYFVIGSGFFIAMSVDLLFGGWLVLLGWLATRLSRAAVDRRRMEQLTSGLFVRDATDRDPAVILPSLTVETLLLQDDETGQGAYPVMEGGQLSGVVFPDRLRGRLRRRRDDQRVRDVVISLERAVKLGPDEPLVRAVERLEGMRIDGLPVVDPDAPTQLYGIATRARVLERLRARHAVAEARDSSASMDARG